MCKIYGKKRAWRPSLGFLLVFQIEKCTVGREKKNPCMASVLDFVLLIVSVRRERERERGAGVWAHHKAARDTRATTLAANVLH